MVTSFHYCILRSCVKSSHNDISDCTHNNIAQFKNTLSLALKKPYYSVPPVYGTVLPHQQPPQVEGGGCRVTSFSSSPALGLPRRPGNMALSTAISILFITRSSNVSTARATLCPVIALVSRYTNLHS